ncbi:MAG: type IV pilus assembly protein PilM [Tepidisphaeraceae bacterium]
MASPRFAWGIDIGNRALKAVKLVRDGDGVRVDDFEFIEHETILSQAGDNKEALIQAALANFVQRHTFKGGVVSVGVSGQNSFARFVKLPPVEEKKIPEIVRFEAIQQIPFPLDDVEWSYQLFREPENPEVEVGIFAMRRELVNQHIAYFTDLDLNVQTVQMNPLAVYNALLYDGRFNDGLTMVVDVGTDNTDLLIADNQSIWMRSIPIGGSNFTEALVKAFKLNYVKAEDLKRNAATSKYARQIFQHMRPVFADLVTEIQRSMGYYSSGHRDAKINKIYTLGATFKLPGLQKYLQQNLQLPVERIDSFAAGAPADPKLAAVFGDKLLSVVSSYGLAVQAMGGAGVNSSLLPRTIQRERMWQEKTKWFGTAAALFVAGTTIVGARLFYENLQFKNAEAVRDKNAATLAQANSISTAWQAVQGAGEAERTTISNVDTLVQGKYLWRDLLTDLINSPPALPADLAAALKARNVDEIKKTPRGERAIIKFDEILPRYDPILATHLADTNFRPQPAVGADTNAGAPGGGFGGGYGAGGGFGGGFGGGGMPPGGFGGATPGAPLTDASGAAVTVDPAGKGRGYIITIRFTCPLTKAVSYIENDVQKALRSIEPDQKRPNLAYAVRKVWILRRNQIREDEPRKQRLRTDYESAMRAKDVAAGLAPGGVPGGPGSPEMDMQNPGVGGYNPQRPFGAPPTFGQPPVNARPEAATLDEEAFKDRLTGESVLNDWEFEIAVAVELDPPAWTPAPPTPPGDQQGAAQPGAAQPAAQ